MRQVAKKNQGKKTFKLIKQILGIPNLISYFTYKYWGLPSMNGIGKMTSHGKKKKLHKEKKVS